VLAYCRTGMRSTTLWGLANAGRLPAAQIISRAAACGYDLSALARRIEAGAEPFAVSDASHQVVIVGGGAAGIAVAASLLARDATLDIAIIDPADVHYYQPGWTLVGAGVFEPAQTARVMGALIPARRALDQVGGVGLYAGTQSGAARRLPHGALPATGGVPGPETELGRHCRPRRHARAQRRHLQLPLRSGALHLGAGAPVPRRPALFTQPPMPIKCAGAPQKAMYLSCDTWRRNGVLAHSQVSS
jgi:sulfide:quinone oxidoreductase